MSFHKPKFSQLSSVIHWVTHFIHSNEILFSHYLRLMERWVLLANVWPLFGPQMLNRPFHHCLPSGMYACIVKGYVEAGVKTPIFEVLKFDFCALMMSKIQFFFRGCTLNPPGGITAPTDPQLQQSVADATSSAPPI